MCLWPTYSCRWTPDWLHTAMSPSGHASWSDDWHSWASSARWERGLELNQFIHWPALIQFTLQTRVISSNDPQKRLKDFLSIEITLKSNNCGILNDSSLKLEMLKQIKFKLKNKNDWLEKKKKVLFNIYI